MKTIIGNKTFFENTTYIMGIINATPDSFSDGNKYRSIDEILFRAQEMISQGTDIIDIGGESTRPGYTEISCDEEIERILPAINAIKARFDIPLSVDTYKYDVAKAALESNADMINDIWGFRRDPEIASLVKEHDASCCLMHNRKTSEYSDFFGDVLSDLNESITIAKNSGICDEKILLDGGVGFAKSYEQNLEILKRTEEISNALGYPIIIAASRKSVIGNTLNLPVDQRLEGTLALTALAYFQGARFARVHDIKENRRVIDMLNAVLSE